MSRKSKRCHKPKLVYAYPSLRERWCPWHMHRLVPCLAHHQITQLEHHYQQSETIIGASCAWRVFVKQLYNSCGQYSYVVFSRPRTMYGVFKLCNEGMARIYWQDHGIPSDPWPEKFWRSRWYMHDRIMRGKLFEGPLGHFDWILWSLLVSLILTATTAT